MVSGRKFQRGRGGDSEGSVSQAMTSGFGDGGEKVLFEGGGLRVVSQWSWRRTGVISIINDLCPLLRWLHCGFIHSRSAPACFETHRNNWLSLLCSDQEAPSSPWHFSRSAEGTEPLSQNTIHSPHQGIRTRISQDSIPRLRHSDANLLSISLHFLSQMYLTTQPRVGQQGEVRVSSEECARVCGALTDCSLQKTEKRRRPALGRPRKVPRKALLFT